jgi:hypothetical protein
MMFSLINEVTVNTLGDQEPHTFAPRPGWPTHRTRAGRQADPTAFHRYRLVEVWFAPISTALPGEKVSFSG